jgi:hypothetical protein
VTHWVQPIIHRKEHDMANDQARTPQPAAQQPGAAPPTPPGQPAAQQEAKQPPDFDGLEGKKPEELTPEELRLMADTMPGEGPGD